MLIKSEENNRKYFFERVLQSSYIFQIYASVLSNELLVQKFSEFLMDRDCLSENMSISHLNDQQNLSLRDIGADVYVHGPTVLFINCAE